MTKPASILDPLRLPLIGARLIEASAGTGKTCTIATLYLRLLLGLGGNAAFHRSVNVEELLVVTFTEAATEELRGRIRSSIHQLRIACLRNKADNSLHANLLEEITDKQQAARMLLLAERLMDEAAIFTIHAFCQRMLRLNAFESGLLFEQQLIENESRLRFRACADFWRRHCYSLPRDIAQIIYANWKGPRALLNAIEPYLQGEVPQFKISMMQQETLAVRHQQNLTQIMTFKQQWQASLDKIITILENSDIDRRKFNRGNQRKWIDEITKWSYAKNTGYQLPEALGKFSQSFLCKSTKKGGVAPVHPIFNTVEAVLVAPSSLNELFIFLAILEIRDTVSREKQHRGELGFDDMLSRLDKALGGGNAEVLARAIRDHFPVAIIDEFQDTDQQQYRIFRRIWHRQPETALLLIGDPKQAIYAFRGADIFTYMRARSDVVEHYTLDTNWRSAPGVVQSVNTLFSLSNNPFMFREIPFQPIKAAAKNHDLRFEFQGKTQPAMTIWLMPGSNVGVGEYQHFMAQVCAGQIRNWLSAAQRGEAQLWRDNVSRSIQASDITVLVRNRFEASLVRDALNVLGIPSVYLSNRDSVFDTREAQELLWVLQAILMPEREGLLRSALATTMFALNTQALEDLNEQALDAVIEEFVGYRHLWKLQGVMAMLRELISVRHIAENLLVNQGGERHLTNILHLIELLQEAAGQLESKHALVRWLMQQIANPDDGACSQQIRLESDKQLVQIVTIHKSKGLEYPLVLLPFIAHYRKQEQAFYHDRESFAAVLDLHNSKESLELAEVERLAEDLRLLYVAMTRAIWHCSLGIAPLTLSSRCNNKEDTIETDLHQSAFGRLLQNGEAKDAAGLEFCLRALCSSEHIVLSYISELPDSSKRWKKALEEVVPELQARDMRRRIVDDWRITSYSALQQQDRSVTQDLLPPRLDIEAVCDLGKISASPETILTPHHIPSGASFGTFLHSLFEVLDFTKPVCTNWVENMLEHNGFNRQWTAVLTRWLNDIMHTPLTGVGIALNQLTNKDKRVEVTFYLPIETLLDPLQLDLLIRRHDSLSAACPRLNFKKVSGMLKGVIDLIFRNKGRYYLLDYKSNRLGESQEAYTHQAMMQMMQLHRYDLQYQLYTLAFHRYLRHRLVNYDYQRHFGGVIYLFLRGMGGHDTTTGHGIFTIRPSQALIDGLDVLFSGRRQEE